MPGCSLRFCKSYYNKSNERDFHLFSFPSVNKSERVQWIKFTQIDRSDENWFPSSSSKLCSKHFKKENIYLGHTGRAVLKKGSIPCIGSKDIDSPEHTIIISTPLDVVTAPNQSDQMEKDMSNYLKFKMGFSKTIRMVDGAVPSKFDCQQEYRKKIFKAGTSTIEDNADNQPSVVEVEIETVEVADIASEDEEVTADIASEDEEVTADIASEDEEVTADIAGEDEELTRHNIMSEEEDIRDTASEEGDVTKDIDSEEEQKTQPNEVIYMKEQVNRTLYTSYVCRCCHAVGCSKDLTTEYLDSGEREVYGDILKETFNIQIFFNSGITEYSKLICDDCIEKLREAYKFRNMVIACEIKLNEYLNKLEDNENVPQAIKTEVEDSETQEDMQIDCMSASQSIKSEVEDHEAQEDIRIDIEFESENIKKAGPSRNLKKKRKKTLESKSKKRKTDSEDDTEKTREEEWQRIVDARGLGPLLRENSLTLLAHSTMFVFQWNKGTYTCHICKEPFWDISCLRQHADTHTLEDTKKKLIGSHNGLLKVEISSLNCKKCSESFTSIDDLQHHLTEQHKIKFWSSQHLLVPFRIESEGLKCQICSENFDIFRLLNMHVNKHFQNQVCDVCGASFTHLTFLNLHKTRNHKTFHCDKCDLHFSRYVDKKKHDVAVHNVKFAKSQKLRFRCYVCGERFSQENFKIKHLVAKHGVKKPEYSCSICGKKFITRSLCNNHKKNVHNKEKKHECDICHDMFFTRSDVSRHRARHTGADKFSCSMCSTTFVSKSSLRRHIARLHH